MPIKGGKKIPYHELMGNIEFADVTFSYPTRPEAVSQPDFEFCSFQFH